MSHRATNWAFAQRGLRPAVRVVLLYLADRHNPDHGCFPSQTQLAADCEMSRSGLNNILEELVQLGLIRRERRINPKTRKQMSTRYILGFEDDFTQEPCPENGHGKGEIPCPKNADFRVQNLDTNPVREPVNTTTDFGVVGDGVVAACLEACGPGLSEQSRSVIRATDGVIHGWIADGADLRLDILPVLSERTQTARPRILRTWEYFSPAVLARQAQRAAQAARLRQNAEKQHVCSVAPESGAAAPVDAVSVDAGADELVRLARLVRARAKLPLSAMVSNRQRDLMLARGLVSPDELRAVQIY
jgi:hypothetical protein